jgi:hypothetical protein
MKKKDNLISDEEAAQILGITTKKLYKVCNFFDIHSNDEWELFENEHFEWLSPKYKTRRFYEEGIMAIAKYLQEQQASNPFTNIIDGVIEKLTNRRKKVRHALVKRRVVSLLQKEDDAVLVGNLVFIERKKVIDLLDTNGKGLNYAAKRERDNASLIGREPLEKGEHFDILNDSEHWSQIGIVRLAQNMSENLNQKSRKAWTEAVCEVCEDAIEQQRSYLESFDSRIKKAISQAKRLANGRCQVSLIEQSPTDIFELHGHHLFDKFNRPDIADLIENILIIHESIHDGFHQWHGSEACEPKHFIDYLTNVELYRFEGSKRKIQYLNVLTNKLEKLQREYG